jgi:hypothetical protein
LGWQGQEADSITKPDVQLLFWPDTGGHTIKFNITVIILP